MDQADAALAGFLERQRADRVRRIALMADKLAAMGKAIDRHAVFASRARGKSLGRPLVAKALVTAGHVADIRQAFEQFIGEGRPAFVPRAGATPAEVIAIVGRAGGIASLAHPGLLKRDDLIPAMVDAGLAAVEAFHSEHDPETTRHYLALAERHGVLVSGGSDYHGDKDHRQGAFGVIGLPRDRFDQLAVRARRKH
jgi:predicted metal-dependent phosphoesterase TrpH